MQLVLASVAAGEPVVVSVVVSTAAVASPEDDALQKPVAFVRVFVAVATAAAEAWLAHAPSLLRIAALVPLRDDEYVLCMEAMAFSAQVKLWHLLRSQVSANFVYHALGSCWQSLWLKGLVKGDEVI